LEAKPKKKLKVTSVSSKCDSACKWQM